MISNSTGQWNQANTLAGASYSVYAMYLGARKIIEALKQLVWQPCFPMNTRTFLGGYTICYRNKDLKGNIRDFCSFLQLYKENSRNYLVFFFFQILSLICCWSGVKMGCQCVLKVLKALSPCYYFSWERIAYFQVGGF